MRGRILLPVVSFLLFSLVTVVLSQNQLPTQTQPVHALPYGVEQAPLTDAQIEYLIHRGSMLKNSPHGLPLLSGGAAFGAWMLNQTWAAPAVHPSEWYSVMVHTPQTWIAYQAALAARQYRKITLPEVDQTMRANVLRVEIPFGEPVYVTEGRRSNTPDPDIKNVVIQDEHRKEALQPLGLEMIPEEVLNALGTRGGFVGIRAIFSMRGVDHLRSLSRKGEFFITLIYTSNDESNYKIKKDYMSTLFYELPRI